MIKTGLVSITFRQLKIEEVVSLVAEAGLDGIEWGGDVHVPHGDIEKAEFARKTTEDAGLRVAAYGSYYRMATEGSPDFADVLQSAKTLGTDKIRVWVGSQGSEKADADYRSRVVDDAKRISDLAAECDIDLVSEWHCNTLTDTLESAQSFLAEVGRENFKTYWQPSVNRPVPDCLDEISQILPKLAGMHVFAWKGIDRLPLEEHADLWRQYFSAGESAGDFYALMEFVRDDSPQTFLRDAVVLQKIVSQLK